jgi:hypothetical protein
MIMLLIDPVGEAVSFPRSREKNVRAPGAIPQYPAMPVNLFNRSCLLAFALIFPISTRAVDRRPITEKDLFDFVWIGDPQISPDGSRLVFVRVTVNDKKLGYDTDIWTVSFAGDDQPHRLTSGSHDSSPRG